VLLGYIEAQVAAIKAYDPMVRGEEPDAVHQMRIASRRLRSTLQSFRKFFNQPQGDELVADLRWLGGELGAARDAEVLSGHLEERVNELPADLVYGPVAAQVRGHFETIGADANAAVLQTLDSPRYFALLDRLDALIEQPFTARATRPAGKVLPQAVLQTYRRTKRRMKHGLGLPPGERADVSLHEARKAAKRARYAGEAVRPAFGPPAVRFTKQMKEIQSVLGEHQDAVIARATARDLGMAAHRAGENSFTYGVLYGRVDDETRRSRKQARRTWRSASRPGVRRWLG
ncbi:MAG: CHAD domain-containing protein, partial [Nocardiopsaceae bacterium]|jgi:CHAD domain-containing protein|nr:CHAD domain-containing protein [Nocardiopsaceae bacterium]